MKYSKNEFHQKTERLAVKQNQEKRSDNDYDPPSLFLKCSRMQKNGVFSLIWSFA